MTKLSSDHFKNCLKLQILLISNKIRNACYDIRYIIDEEIQNLMDYYELILYKEFIIHKSNKYLLDSLDLNSVNIGKILGYVNYTHLDEKARRFRNNITLNTMNDIGFSIVCDDYHIFTEVALIDYDNFNMDVMIKYMEELEKIYENTLHQYGYKNVQFKLLYRKKTYNDNQFYKTIVDKVNIEKRIIILT